MEILLFLVFVIILCIGFLCLTFLVGAIHGAPFIPSEKEKVEAMIDLCGNIKNKVIYDAGCGDGRILFAAEIFQPEKLIGIDISLGALLLAKVKKFLKKSNAQFVHQSIWKTDFSGADIVFIYLLPGMMKRFQKEIYPHLKPGTLLVCNGFTFPDLLPQVEKKISSGQILVYRR